MSSITRSHKLLGPQIVSTFNNLANIIIWEGNRFPSAPYKLFDKDINTLVNTIIDGSIPTSLGTGLSSATLSIESTDVNLIEEKLIELTKETSGNKRISSYSIFNFLIQCISSSPNRENLKDLINYVEFLRENSSKFLHSLPDSLSRFKHYMCKLRKNIYRPQKFHKKKTTEELLLIYIRDIIIILELCRLITVGSLIVNGCRDIKVDKLIEESKTLIQLFDTLPSIFASIIVTPDFINISKFQDTLDVIRSIYDPIWYRTSSK